MMRTFTILLFSILTTQICFAQDADIYDLQVLNEDYVDLENPISLNEGSTWEEPFYFIPIGFPFEYQGTAYNYTVTFLGAGVLGFTNDTSYYYEPESLPIILAHGSDLADAAYDYYNQNNQSESPISYSHSGSDGSRVFTYEVKNAAFEDQLIQYPNPTNTSRVSFQIILNEVDHSIEFHYGPSIIDDVSLLGNSGLQAGLIQDFSLNEYEFQNFQFLLNDPNSPDFPFYANEQEAIAAGLSSFLDGQPTEGTKYRITNPNQVVGLQNITAYDLNVYPSVVQNVFTIENPSLGKKVTVQIIDAQGKLWQTETITTKNEIDISQLAKGIYFVTLTLNEKLYVKQIVKN